MPDEVRIGVDVGGTFTDVVTVHDGRLRVTKTPTTPADPSVGVIDGLEEAARRGSFDPDAVEYLGHGTTVATNAVLEREWAETALVTNEGFRDVLEIGRQARPDIYDFQAEKPEPVVPRQHRFEVSGRIDEHGEELVGLDEAAVRDVAESIRDADVDSVAVSLLFAFEEDSHEQQIREILETSGLEAAVSLSSEVHPEIREYERTLATALNAALQPVMADYLRTLARRSRAHGIDADLAVMQSNGGVITADVATERPITTLLSGPAAGVQGATFAAGLAGHEDVITMDMGGTSCDVSLVEAGDPLVTTDVEVGDYPVSVPMVDIHTVGAGGGSIAWLDDGGALRVGPRSAGADPGPVCYGLGGTDPTITDAHLLLGRLDVDAFQVDHLGTDRETVEAIFERELADPLDSTPREVAQGVLDVANANMARALRVVSVERGFDPRDFTLVAFGGAGPLHATRLAAELDIPRVLVPRTAGVLSALGLLVSDVVVEDATSHVRPLADVAPATIQAAFEEFAAAGTHRLDDANVDPDHRVHERALDLRYAGQSFELRVPVPDGPIDDATLRAVREGFHDAHRTRYGHADDTEPVELVTIRSRYRGRTPDPDLAYDGPTDDEADAETDTRTVTFPSGTVETRVYDRSRLPVDAVIEGPAIVEGIESTLVVRPGDTARVDSYGSIIVEVA